MNRRLPSFLRFLFYNVLLLCVLGSAILVLYPFWKQAAVGSVLGAFLDRNWEDLAIGLIIAVAFGMVASLGSDLRTWLESKRNAIYVEHCALPSAEQRAAIKKIYQDHFHDEDNYDLVEFSKILEAAPEFAKDRPLPTEMVLFLASRGSAVTAFLLAFYYPTKRRAIIGYLAAAKERGPGASGGGSDTTLRLIRAFGNYLKSCGCEMAFYELADTSDADRSRRSRAQGRYVLFRDLAGRAGTEIFQLGFAYSCPRVSNQPFGRESRGMLLCIPLSGTLPDRIPKQDVAEFLRFIYLDCYGDFYPSSSREFLEHRKYLEGFLQQQVATLPDEIEAIS